MWCVPNVHVHSRHACLRRCSGSGPRTLCLGDDAHGLCRTCGGGAAPRAQNCAHLTGARNKHGRRAAPAAVCFWMTSLLYDSREFVTKPRKSNREGKTGGPPKGDPPGDRGVGFLSDQSRTPTSSLIACESEPGEADCHNCPS